MPYKYNPISGEIDFYEAGSGGTVTSVSGTLNRITVTNGTTTPVIDIAVTYVGQTSLTTLGTISTGVWNGTAINETHGGTNQTTYTTGDLLYASAANTLSKLGIGSAGKVLTVVAGIPSWQTPAAGTVTSVSGTAGRITSTGGATPVIDIDAAYVGQSSITTLGTITTGTWNGTAVDATHGGTAQTTYATGDTLYASASNTLSKLTAGTNGQVMTLASGIPSWSAAPYNVSNFSGGKIYVVDSFITSGTLQALGWSVATANSASSGTSAQSGHFGVIKLSRGTSSNGAYIFYLPNAFFPAGAVKFGFYMKIPTLPDGTNRFDTEFGVSDLSTTADAAITDGLYFRYVDDENSGKWQIIATKDSTPTNSDSGVAADTNWNYFEIEANAGWTSINYYINGTLTANSPISTHIPANTDALRFFFRIVGTDGGTNRDVYFDTFYFTT